MDEEKPNRFQLLNSRKRRIHTNRVGTHLLRKQSKKRSDILNKHHEEPIASTVVKSKDMIAGLAFKASDLAREHKLIGFDSLKKESSNWFKRFLDKSRDTLYNKNNPIAFAFKVQLRYSLLIDRKISEYER